MQYNITIDPNATPYNKHEAAYILRREAVDRNSGELVTKPTYLGKTNYLADNPNDKVVRRYVSYDTARRQADKLHFESWKREHFGWERGYYENYIPVPVYYTED